jgi:hypothetical protein
LRPAGTGGEYVFIVENRKAVRKTIKTGYRDDYYVEVTEGLASGDMVVTSGTGRIWHGKAVTIRKVNTLKIGILRDQNATS